MSFVLNDKEDNVINSCDSYATAGYTSEETCKKKFDKARVTASVTTSIDQLQ